MRWTLIHKYLSKQCSDAERAKVEQWVNENTDHKIFMESVTKIWNVAPKREKKVDVEAAWKLFKADRMTSENIHRSHDYKNSVVLKKHINQPGKWYEQVPVYTAAAVIALILVVFFVVQNQFGGPAELFYQEIITAKGEKATINLGDGTKVMLNAESVLKIPSNYGENKRVLHLKGEAFFVVEHDADRPFLVYSGDVYTKDLGTKFNIKAYGDGQKTRVVVVEGKVALGNTKKDELVHLTSNERAVVSETGKTEVHKVKNVSLYIGWTEGKMVFKDTPFREVMKQLERWYGVECTVTDSSLLNQRLTATFQNISLSNVLLLITKSMNIEAKMEQRTVTFSSSD